MRGRQCGVFRYCAERRLQGIPGSSGSPTGRTPTRSILLSETHGCDATRPPNTICPKSNGPKPNVSGTDGRIDRVANGPPDW